MLVYGPVCPAADFLVLNLQTQVTDLASSLAVYQKNVNSIRYKFYEINDILNGNRIDIFGLSETQFDASFTDAQFL